MHPFATVRWLDLPRTAGLALLFFLFTLVSTAFATPFGSAPLISPQTGLALAALLILGYRCWPGIFLAAFAAGVMQNHGWLASFSAGSILTLALMLGACLLRRFDFDIAMRRTRDVFLLFLLASVISSGLGALASMLVLQQRFDAMTHAWLGNMLGIILFTPMLLIWRQRPEKPARRTVKRWWIIEIVTLCALAFLVGQIIFLDWLHDAFGHYPKGYLMFIFVVWAAIRFGRHGVLLLLGMSMLQGVISADMAMGHFSRAVIQGSQINFSIYFSELILIGLLLAAAILERNTTAATLRASDARFSSFMRRMPGLALIKDAQRNIVYRNNSVAAQKIESALPHPRSSDGLKQIQTDEEMVLSDRMTVTSEVAIGDANAQQALLSITFPVTGANNTRLIGNLLLDITPRKLAEERIRQLTQLYQTLSHVNQCVVRLQSEADLFPLVCQMVVKDGGMKMAWVGMPDEDSGLIKPVVWHGDGTGYLDGLAIAGGAEANSPPAMALHRNRHVLINHFNHSQPADEWERALRYGFHSTASFPIMQAGKPYAVLSVYSHQANAFDSESIALLDELTSDISFALDNFERERQRQQTQRDLENSEKRFRAFFERSMVGMSTSSPDKRWIAANDALCQMLGYPREQLLGKRWIDLTHPDDLEINLALYHRVLCGDIDEYEMDKRFIRSDGNIVHTHIAARAVRMEDGGIDYFVTLVQDITESKRSAELIWKQANFDSLTGLINRNLFNHRLQQEIIKAERTRLPMALVFIDLDLFKEVNDTLGHAMGDALLAQTAERIGSCVRASDTLARLGGDEFVIILTDCASKAPVSQIARAILARLEEPFDLPDGTAHITASIGIAFYPTDATDMESLLSRADQAMYVAKKRGRNRFSYFSQNMQHAVQHRLSRINDLRTALADEQLLLYFQPIVDLASGQIFKAEALVRWQHPKNGIITPDKFIPLAEETGLLEAIGDWVFREAARWANRWSNLPQGGIQISVNKSPAQFILQGIDPDAWLAHLHELGLPGKFIAIEITEDLLMNAEPTIMDRLLKFRDAGIQVALDDFGTGRSSLSYLNKFDIDYLKIDRSFIRNLTTDPFDRALSEAIIVMAHTLGLQVIAEGVETQGQRTLLSLAGCDFAQGFLFSPPLPAMEFEAMLLSS